MNNTTLPKEFQLPTVFDIEMNYGHTSPLEQEAFLQTRAIRILSDLSNIRNERAQRLSSAQHALDTAWMGQVDMMIAEGKLPSIPGVIRQLCLSPITVDEKTREFQAKGYVHVKTLITPTALPGTVHTTLIYCDPEITTIEKVKESMLEAKKAEFRRAVDFAQVQYDKACSDIEKFHKHYVATVKEIVSMSDRFKAAKA